MHVVDPMHNLLLGTSKHIFSIWIKKEVINEKKDVDQLSRLQRLVNVPAEYGRLPHNIIKARKRMKAEEWKTFTLVYSLFCLKSLLSKEQFDHWNLFVNACRIVCKRVITKEEIETAHSLFVKFCKGIEDLYGKDTCTPNTHLHLHLKQCMIDFGPVFSFWCFSFERFNGILGSYHTNKKDIVVTTMRKFCKEAKVNSLDHNDYNLFMSSKSTKPVKNLSKDLLLKRNKPISLNDNLFTAHLKPTSLPSKIALTEEKIESLILLCKTIYHPHKVHLVSRIATLFERFCFLMKLMHHHNTVKVKTMINLF